MLQTSSAGNNIIVVCERPCGIIVCLGILTASCCETSRPSLGSHHKNSGSRVYKDPGAVHSLRHPQALQAVCAFRSRAGQIDLKCYFQNKIKIEIK